MADERAIAAVLSEDEKAILAAGVDADLNAGWSDHEFDGPPLLTVAAVERILAGRATPVVETVDRAQARCDRPLCTNGDGRCDAAVDRGNRCPLVSDAIAAVSEALCRRRHRSRWVPSPDPDGMPPLKRSCSACTYDAAAAIAAIPGDDAARALDEVELREPAALPPGSLPQIGTRS